MSVGFAPEARSRFVGGERTQSSYFLLTEALLNYRRLGHLELRLLRPLQLVQLKPDLVPQFECLRIEAFRWFSLDRLAVFEFRLLN